MKNKSIKIVSLLFIFLVALDLTSTLLLKDMVQYLESNPVYQYIGLTGIVILNFVCTLTIYYLYTKTQNDTTRFVLINGLVMISIIRIFAIINNYMIAQNPPTLAEAKLMTTEFKTRAYVNFVAPTVIPYFGAIISYIIFRLDHKIQVK